MRERNWPFCSFFGKNLGGFIKNKPRHHHCISINTPVSFTQYCATNEVEIQPNFRHSSSKLEIIGQLFWSWRTCLAFLPPFLSSQPSTRRLILPLLHLQTSASSSGGDSWSGLSASPPVTPDLQQVGWVKYVVSIFVIQVLRSVQCSCSGWPKGNREKLSRSQAQLSQATCLAVA